MKVYLVQDTPVCKLSMWVIIMELRRHVHSRYVALHKIQFSEVCAGNNWFHSWIHILFPRFAIYSWNFTKLTIDILDCDPQIFFRTRWTALCGYWQISEIAKFSFQNSLFGIFSRLHRLQGHIIYLCFAVR